jgi:hypothetical protein
MTQMANSFHWRGMVTDRDAFVGRERELASIFTRLKQLGCVSVVGERRIGKSSLAYQASLRAVEQLGSGCRAVFIDMLSAKHHTLQGLLTAILQGLGAKAELGAGSAPEMLAAFEAAVREVRKRGGLPVVFLDEFEALGERIEQFGDDLLESWRSLGNDGQIAFVTTSAHPMDQVTRESGLTSSFYNIFAQMTLGEFAEKEAREFAQRAVRVGRLEMGDDVFILRVGKQRPLALQVAAWQVFEARQAGRVDYGVLEQQAKAEIAAMVGKSA